MVSIKFKITGCFIALLILFPLPAFAQWQWAYTQEVSYNFKSVHFPTADVGYIVGSGGAIYKTENSGVLWVQQASPVTTTLEDVFFTDATHGFAVGWSGTIIYTTDGTNWNVHAQSGVITTTTINAICFVGTSGWFATNGSPNNIYLSTDGGTTWALAGGTNPSTDDATGVSFYDAQHGYASLDGAGCMYSHDGGVNWTMSTVNLGPYPYTRTDIECILALDATHAVAAGWGSMIGTQPTIIIVSSDTGATFNNPDPTYPWATRAYGWGIGKFSDGEAMVVGGGFGSASVTVHATSPYTTWSKLPAFFSDDLNAACTIPGTSKVVAVGDAGCIARSEDRGLTWNFIYKPGTAFQGINAFEDAGKDRVFAAGVSSTLLKFNLAAGTVKYTVVAPDNWGAELTDIKLVENIMYTCGKNGYLCRSYDLGNTWTELYHSVSMFDYFMKTHWFDSDTGIVVGCKTIDPGTRRGETIWRTTDGGNTLTEVWSYSLNPATSMYFYSVSFAPENPAIGVAVGSDNAIVYTTDRGYHWTQATEDIASATVDLEEVCMVNSLLGWAVGSSGTAVRTTDGGLNWFVQAGPWGTTQLMDVYLNTPTHGWVVGDDGLVYYTKDGGMSWTSASANAELGTRDVNSVYYHGKAGMLWIGADYSDVLYRTDGVAGTETPKNLPFVLNQNYPNPFNPSTTIEFTLDADDHVSLNVYDVKGVLVAKVLDREIKAGKHVIGFKADGLASGVYFYKLSTSKGEETRKMILIR